MSQDYDREELNRIGVALSSTRDVDVLLQMILSKARQITCADAGSLYLVETCGSDNGLSGRSEKQLRFKLTQNDTRQFPYKEQTLPLTDGSMAGYAAVHGEVIVLDDVYRIPEDRPYRFNPSYDEETRYRTRSVLTVPMKNARGDVLGVMQLLNRKRDRNARLLTLKEVDSQVEPFPVHAVRLAESLASQAAVAYENNQLYQSIQFLFDGFVRAAITAIEQRDPSTSGHSGRVANMTLALAEAVNCTTSGPYADVNFTSAQLTELRYATLLHDFGKIAVREDVLVKAKKLYPSELAIIEQRFDYIQQQLELECTRKKLELLKSHCIDVDLSDIDAQYAARQREVQHALQLILRINESNQSDQQMLDQLICLASMMYCDRNGVQHPLLTHGELSSLSVKYGSLNEDERREIESHVMHSFNFLLRIPWTPELRFIPLIVRAHHEKLNGAGYPNKLGADDIPIQSRMMTICDIFDALCSADRPYKKAVPCSRALEILQTAARDGEIDRDLYRIFVEHRVFEVVTGGIETNEQLSCPQL